MAGDIRLQRLPYKLGRSKARIVNEGLAKIAPMNPAPIDGGVGPRDSWLVLGKDDEPLGYLSVRREEADNMTAGELAVNFWNPPVSAPKLVARWIAEELKDYDGYTARVWARNRRIKKFLWRAGFALVDKEGPLEVYAGTRVHVLRLMERYLREPVLSGIEGEE